MHFHECQVFELTGQRELVPGLFLLPSHTSENQGPLGTETGLMEVMVMKIGLVLWLMSSHEGALTRLLIRQNLIVSSYPVL